MTLEAAGKFLAVVGDAVAAVDAESPSTALILEIKDPQSTQKDCKRKEGGRGKERRREGPPHPKERKKEEGERGICILALCEMFRVLLIGVGGGGTLLSLGKRSLLDFGARSWPYLRFLKHTTYDAVDRNLPSKVAAGVGVIQTYAEHECGHGFRSAKQGLGKPK